MHLVLSLAFRMSKCSSFLYDEEYEPLFKRFKATEFEDEAVFTNELQKSRPINSSGINIELKFGKKRSINDVFEITYNDEPSFLIEERLNHDTLMDMEGVTATNIKIFKNEHENIRFNYYMDDSIFEAAECENTNEIQQIEFKINLLENNLKTARSNLIKINLPLSEQYFACRSFEILEKRILNLKQRYEASKDNVLNGEFLHCIENISSYIDLLTSKITELQDHLNFSGFKNIHDQIIKN